MTHKETVETYMNGFNNLDHTKILACLTDDVLWEMPGFFNLLGKEQFDKEIENDAFEGRPVISLIRMIEEGDIVIAEGRVMGKMKNGGILDAVFCDVFHFRGDKIKQLTTYLMPKKQPGTQ